MTEILQFTCLPWLSIFKATSQAREQTVQRLQRFSFLKNIVALPCNSQFASKMKPTMIRGLPHFREVSSFPVPCLPHSQPWGPHYICHFTARAELFVLCSKVDFPRNFGILDNIDLLQLTQIFKLNLACKKDQVSFRSNRDNVNSGQYCAENKQALPRNPHWSPTSVTEL